MRARAFVAELTAAVCAAALLLPATGRAQPLGPGPHAEGGPAYGETLPPRDIVASVRSAGFSPLSRPVQRGPVYVVFAVDRYFMDVRVTVDARSGRIMAVTRLAGLLYGGSGSGSYELVPGAPPGYLPPYGERPPRGGERPPVPPADVPLYGGNQPNPPEEAPPVEVAKRLPRRLPLPRARPDTPEIAKEPVAQQQPSAEPKAATLPLGQGEAAPLKPTAAQDEAASRPPQQPAMVPVAPLE